MKKFFLFLLLSFAAFLSGCQQGHKSKVISSLLLENYANLEVNGEERKRRVIEEIKKFDQIEITKENIRELKKSLNQIEDGHVFLRSLTKEDEYQSDLEFIPGSFFVKSCLNSCSPAINEKMRITKIDGMDFSSWLEANKTEVFASTFYGRNFRLSRLLRKNSWKESFQLELIDSKKKNHQVSLNLRQSGGSSHCVSGKRLENDLFVLGVREFYCSDPAGKKTEFDYFKFSLDQVTKEIKENDRIVLDLRENNGGGDDEVIYLLNHFIDRPVFLYEYKHLKAANLSKKEWLESFFLTGEGYNKKERWLHEHVLLTINKGNYLPTRPLFKNKMITLISAGCFSNCEGAAEALGQEKRSLLVGTTTHGGQSEPHPYLLKGGMFELYLPSCIVYKRDKGLYEGIGVNPQIVFEDQFKTSDDDLLLSVTDYPFQ